MGKAKMLGQFKPFVANARADMRKAKAWQRSREYTESHEETLAESRDRKQMREKKNA